ncbi:MAG: PIG-L family deacetylase [Propionibacteriaceae bacterium]|jgi:N-acetyl-1-D-myo-inositol-2-amino-2-deoxy-alpha-D-glucopyranoside deacetylase|nr:PIG-L family deacetylase [Propionibacteriaceae bacterium]
MGEWPLGQRPTGVAAKRRIVLLHAHPDDETIATGALIAHFVAQGIAVAVVTATRGERGEVYPGVLAVDETLLELRERELRRATQVLGVTAHCFLGEPPARAKPVPRRYLDSGMRWVTPTLAGPVADAGPQALSNADPVEPAADLVAFCRAWQADALISYDEAGGYGHPDHIACHEIAVTAAQHLGIDCFWIVSDLAGESADGNTANASLERDAARASGEQAAMPDPSGERFSFDLAGQLDTAKRALACYASQLRVDGDEIVHVGGQRDPIVTKVELALH